MARSQRAKATTPLGTMGGRNVLQNVSGRSQIAVPKHFQVSKVDLGTNCIRMELHHVSETGGRGRPVTHKKVIESGVKNHPYVPRIKGDSAVVAGHRFAPASLPSIDSTDVAGDLGIIGRSRRGDLELFERRVVILISQKEAKTPGHMSFR